MKALFKTIKNNHLLTISFFLFVIILLSIISTKPVGWRYNEDDLSTVSPAIINYQTGYWLYKNKLNNETNTYGFIPSGYLINQDGLLFPKGFLGLKILFLTFYSIVGLDLAINLWQTITYFLSILVVMITLNIFLSWKKSLAGTMLFGVSPFILNNLNSFYQEITVLFIMLISLLMLIKYEKTKSNIFIFLSFLFYFLVLLIKLNYIVIFPVYFFIYIIHLKEKKVISSPIKLFYSLLLIFIIFVIIYSPQLIFNYKTMGSPLSYSFTSYTNVYSNKIMGTSEEQNAMLKSTNQNLFFYRLKNEYIKINKDSSGDYYYLINIKTAPYLLFFLFPLSFLFVYFYFFNKNYFLFIVLFSLFGFLFLANIQGGFGVGDTSNLRSSLSRYMIFPFCLIILGSIISLFYLNFNKRILTILIFFIILFMSNILVNYYPFNTYVFGDIKDHYTFFSESIESNTPKSSVIYEGGFDDGFLVGRRTTFNFNYLPTENSYEIIKSYKYLRDNAIKTYLYFYNGTLFWNKSGNKFNFEKCFNLKEITKYKEYYILYEIVDIKEEECKEYLFSLNSTIEPILNNPNINNIDLN